MTLRALGVLLPLLTCPSASDGPGAAAPEPERRTLKVHYGPKDREAGRYQYVPVDVAPGTTRLHIEYRYDRAEGANVIDLGLFEPGPLELGAARCRGWSGGERTAITVTPEAATPGYWPGPLPPGRWHVQLGLYKVAEGGVEVEIVVETGKAGVLRRGPAWYSGDLHLHTHHSDGTLGVAELSGRAREAGLDFIAITDHNNTAHQTEPVEDDGLLRIVGEEVTTPGGHANVWGLGPRDWIDFRTPPGEGGIGALVQAALDRGAIFSINHPFAPCAGCSWEHAVPPGVGALEIWNGWSGPQELAIALWDELLRQGRRITGVGSSDWHRPPAPLARGSVRVHAAELSTAAILEGIRAGRVIVMGDGKTPPPDFTAAADGAVARVGDTLSLRRGSAVRVEVQATSPAFAGSRAELIWNGAPAGSAPLADGVPARFALTASQGGYLRAEVHAASGSMLALTNPVYVVIEAGP